MENTDLVVGEFLYRPGGRERRDTGARLERKDMPTLSKRESVSGGGWLRHREVQKKRPIWFFSAGVLHFNMQVGLGRSAMMSS